MAFTDIGIDLGTTNIVVWHRGRGVIIHEPSIVAYDKQSDKIIAYGEEARQVAEEVVRRGSLAPLKGCPFLLLGRHDEPGDLSRQLLSAAGFDNDPAIVSSNSETLVELAMRDVGATFVPLDLAHAMVGEGEINDMCIMNLGPDARIDIHVAWRQSSHVWSVIEDFADLLVEQVRGDEVQ